MIEFIKNAIGNKELVVFILAMLPVSELRGAIPTGLALGMPLTKTLIISLIGNFLPVIPLLFLFEPISARLRRVFVLKRFFDWFFERTKKKAQIVQHYEALGLAVFVGIPLPMTGAWTGCVAATLFKIRFKYALISILIGILLAGAIVVTVCYLGKGTYILLTS